MAAAVLLAKLHGKKVLVLERHFRAGGFTHVFSRKGGYNWDVGVHYVGEVTDADSRASAKTNRELLDVVTGGEVRWNRMPEEFDKLVFPGFTFSIRAGKENFRSDLNAAFPSEASSIDRYLADVERAASYAQVLGMRGLAPAPFVQLANVLHYRARKLAFMTTGEYLNAHIKDERLKAVLGARWGDFGLPPAQSAFLIHAIVARHYFEGAYYPVGSAARIAEAATRVLEGCGGEIRVRAEVAQILVEQGKAVGVRLTSGETIRADRVISDAGARNTYLRLLPREVELPFRSELEATPSSLATTTLYLGLKSSPESIGIKGENYWIHDELDQDSLYARRDLAHEGVVPMCFLSFPSLKDPEARRHTAEITTGVDPAAFERWSGTRWMKRGEDYLRVKERIAGALLHMVEARLPGFRDLVEYSELSTPLSTENFTAHPRGEIYGIPATPERYRKSYLQVRTPVKNLLLTGADALSLGVAGAANAGLLCAVAASSPITFRKLSNAAKQLRHAPAPTAAATSLSTA
jgi:phytoene dehydrogenase-like protein